MYKREDHEPPAATTTLGWKYHHMGIPYTGARSEERHLEHLGMHVYGFETSPYGTEWMRFDDDCTLPELVKTVAHVAFEVEDLDEALKGREIIVPPGVPSNGVRAAMIVHNGAPIELIEFRGCR